MDGALVARVTARALLEQDGPCQVGLFRDDEWIRRAANGNMKIVCAWCNKKIGGKGTSLSHGICNKCLAQLKQPQFGFMQTLTVSPTRALGGRTRNRSRPVRAAGYQRPGSGF